MKNSIFKSHAGIRIALCFLAGALLTAIPAIAQDAQQPGFPVLPAGLEKQLAERASNVSEVTLNKNMLNFGSQFLDSKKTDDQQAKNLIQKLNAIYVRDYEFDQPGAYTAEDLKTIRRRFLGPEWSPMVQERSKKGGDNTDVFVKLVNGEIHGMFVLDAEPKELSLVYISGTINPHELGQLSGNFGIPKINTGSANGAKGDTK
ncbi:MAG: DUF4252 domain-containing protein [Acidobacteriaceae bacterium]